MVNYWLSFFISLLFSAKLWANSDSLIHKTWLRNKISFGRSQHIQYPGRSSHVNTLLNKAYYVSLNPINIRGLKPFIGINYEYFFTRAICNTCIKIDPQFVDAKAFHFINFLTIGTGITYEYTFKNKEGKELELMIGASIERYFYRQAYIFQTVDKIKKTTTFVNTHPFYNSYFFKDMIGFRAYNAHNYKVFIQLSGLLLRNERLYYQAINHTFNNFMLGFKVYLK